MTSASTRLRPPALIVDTAPLVALGDARDPQHEKVRRILENEPGELVVPAPVTAEADYLLRRRGGRDAARRFVRDIADGRFRVESLTRDEHATVLVVDQTYAGLDLGLADLSVIVLAHRFGTQRLLTFDYRDFRAVQPLSGDTFMLLPADEAA